MVIVMVAVVNCIFSLLKNVKFSWWRTSITPPNTCTKSSTNLGKTLVGQCEEYQAVKLTAHLKEALLAGRPMKFTRPIYQHRFLNSSVRDNNVKAAGGRQLLSVVKGNSGSSLGQ